MDLTPLEQVYAEKLCVLFARVDARHPEKGIETLLQRARSLSRQKSLPIGQALDEVYQGAVERTERRLLLLGQCSLKSSLQD